MKMTKISLLIIFSIGILIPNNMKIGYIDSNKIMSELEEVREVQVQLEKEQRRMESEMEAMLARRDSMINAYNLQKILLVDENKRAEKEAEIQNLEQRIQQFQMDKFGPNNGEIYRISNQLFAPVQAKIQAAIDKVGKERGYDYIIDALSGALVYALPQHDFTDDVIEELRKTSSDGNIE